MSDTRQYRVRRTGRGYYYVEALLAGRPEVWVAVAGPYTFRFFAERACRKRATEYDRVVYTIKVERKQ